MELENALRDACAHNELELHYQPRVSLDSGRMCGIEAQLGWRHPQLGLLYYDQFIAIAAQEGLTDALVEWALDAACRQMAEWRRDRLERMEMAVKIPSGCFNVGGLTKYVARVIRDYGILPGVLEIDIDGSLPDRPAESAATCRALQRLGARVAINAFGDGHATFAALTNLPVNTWKLSPHFIDELRTGRHGAQGAGLDGSAAADIGIIVGMANALSVTVVAEGVECLEQAQALKRAGCGQAQGLHFSRPVLGIQIPALARKNMMEPPAYPRSADAYSMLAQWQ